MKLEFQRLKDSSALLSIAILIGLSALFLMNEIENQVNSQKDQSDRKLQILENQLKNRRENQQIITEYGNSFVKQLAAGQFMQENRMNWIASVRNQAERMKLPEMKYTLGSRKPFEANSFAEITIYETPITLEFGMIHEADLINLVGHFTKARLGRFSSDQCSLERIGGIDEFLADQANLSASCSLKWFSFAKKVPANESTLAAAQ